MAQQGNTVNFLIQDANGQTQVIKVLQSTPGKLTTPGGRTTNVVSSVANQGMKTIFKTPGQGAGQGTSLLASGTQVLRTLSLQQSPKKTVQRPHVVAMIQSSNTKTSPVKLESPILPKTIHIASNPMVLSTQQRLAAQHVLPPSNAQKNFISPILDHSGSRKRQESENDFMPEYKRRKTDKVGKGLRHFSMKVCEKVRKKGTTSYNEVADELVSEFTNPSLMNCPKDQQYDQKNIRRRVYDALNVLMAMNIISKEKKEIRWLGLPTNSLQEVINLQKDKQRRVDRIRQKKQQLHDLILQQISFKNLVERNRLQEQQTGIPATNSAIQLPFIIINTNRQTVIDCSISNDKSEYLFNFDDKFEIHDDIEVLKRMGMVMGLDKAECTPENVLKAKSMVPKALGSYIDELSVGPLEEEEEEMMDETETVPGPSAVAVEMLDLELSRQSSHTSMSDADPMSPTMNDFSDEESEASSDLEVN